MPWLLTERLAQIMPPGLAKAVRAGEGFELLTTGRPVSWRVRSSNDTAGGFAWSLEQIDGPLVARQQLHVGREGFSWGRYETVIENQGGTAVKLSGIYPLMLRLPGIDGPWRILRSRGGSSENFYPPRAYSQARRLVYGGEVRLHGGSDGYSSDNHLPLLIACPEGSGGGLFCGMEFSASWEITLRHVANRPFLRGQVLDGPIELPGGESLTLPSVHLGFFEGDIDAGAAALRDYLRRHVIPSPPPAWRDRWPPVSWCNFPHLADDAGALGPQIELAAQLGAEVAIVRPGKGEGATATSRLPVISDLAPLLDDARARGLAAGLWLDIETLSEARALEFVSQHVRKLGLDYLVLDTRLAGRPCHMMEYVAGLYRVLEHLRERFPHLVIENSAAGGRRIDLGTLRRCHLHWLSDQTHNPHISRFHLLRAGQLLPSDRLVTALVAAHRPGRRYTHVDALSRFAGCLRLAGDLTTLPEKFRAELAGLITQYKRLRPLLAGDFQVLFHQPRDENDPDGCLLLPCGRDSDNTPSPRQMKLTYRMAEEEEIVEEAG